MIELTAEERRALRARAHGLSPVVSISENGLSEAVLKEIDASLKAHELVKVRVYGDDREQREAWMAEICQSLVAAPVQHIGKLLVIWRPEPKGPNSGKRGPGKSKARTTKRSMQGSTRR
jgi:putative YhbY family RNA-binding protein